MAQMESEKRSQAKEAVNASRTLRKSGRHLDAEEQILHAWRDAPDSLALMIERAELAMSWNSWREAADRWQQVLERAGEAAPASAYARYSEALRHEARYDDADRIIKDGMVLHQNKATLMLEDAQVAWRRRELARAAASLYSAFNIKGSLKAREHVRLVACLRKIGKIDDAKTHLKVALEEYPDNKGLLGEQFEIELLLDESLTASQLSILRLLRYTTGNVKAYSAAECPSGYQSAEIDGRKFDGLRPASERFVGVPVDFTGKSILDIGCNQGAMLFEIADKIKHGVGIDYDHTMVNVCNRIKSHREIHNIDFYSFDLQEEDFDLIGDLLPGGRVDIVFLLAVCRWVSNYPDLMAYCAKISDTMLFEPNGPEKEEQLDHLRKIYSSVSLIDENYEYARKNRVRSKIYLCNL